MIVADTTLVVYLVIGGAHTSAARAVLERDRQWIAPRLWRSEMRNVLAGYLRRSQLTLEAELAKLALAAAAFGGREYDPDAGAVLALAASSGCSAYDCEFVALAEALDVPLVTSDAQVLAAFPGRARSPEAFLEGGAG